MNKKVCVFTLHPTQDVRILNRQCRSLQKNGWDVTLIAIANKRLDANAIVGPYEDAGIKVIGVEKWKTFRDRVKTLFKITNLALKENADLYHFHDPHLIVPALRLMKKVKKPFVYDIHEYYDMQLVYCLPAIWPIQQIAGTFVRFFETWLGKRIHNISVVCEEHVDRYQKIGCNVIHTPNYASPEDFKPEPVSDVERISRMKKIIYTGSITPGRGSMMVPEIAKIVKDKIPDAQFMVIRRFHNLAHEQAFLNVLSKPGYENCIEFLPNVSGKELPKLVRSAGIALSVDPENVICAITSPPTKLFEYMSQSLAIVASRLPNTKVYVEKIGCGILVKPDDPRQYAEAIIRLIENPDLAREMGEKGQKAFIEKYNWSVVEKRLIEFYNSIMESCSRNSSKD